MTTAFASFDSDWFFGARSFAFSRVKELGHFLSQRLGIGTGKLSGNTEGW